MNRTATSLLLGTLLLPGALLAQSGPASSGAGMWWGATVGAAGARLTCDICDPSRDRGPTLGAEFGTWAGTATRVGLDLGGFTFRDGDFRETVWTGGLHAAVYPRPTRGLHLIGGLGWTGYRANDVEPEEDEDGFAYDALRLRLGLGWDLPLTGAWVVGNSLVLDASSLGTLHDEGSPIAESVGLSVVRFSVYLHRRQEEE